MNLLDRAKSFIAQRTSRLAMVAALLSAVTIGSAATVQASFGAGSCSLTQLNGNCSVTHESATGGNPATNWISVSATLTPQISGGSLFASGSATGTLSSNIPVAYDFTFSPGTYDSGWILMIGLNSDSFVYTNYGSSSGGQTVSGSGVIDISAPTRIRDYEFELTVGCLAACTINIPANSSLDLNPIAPSVPEPATLVLIPGAGALLLLRARRRNAKQG